MSARTFNVAEIKPRMWVKIKQGCMVYTGQVIKADPQVVLVSIVSNGNVIQGPVKRTEIAAAWFETKA